METDKLIHQEIVFRGKAHRALLKGADILTNAVASTMGPSGHSVILDAEVGAPTITKDGVTVARAINLKDRLESIGAELMKEIASKTNDLAGDGTTTATVLGRGLLKEGVKQIASGRSAIALKRGLDFGAEKAFEFLRNFSIEIRDKNDIINVGAISANGDREIGELIADAISKVGKDGIITIEPAKSVNTTLDIVEGMQLDKGFVSPFFITDNDKATCVLKNPWVLMTSNRISSIGEILPILEKVSRKEGSLLIVADEIEGDALHTLIVNKMKGVLKVCAVKAPSYGEHRADILDDLTKVIGGEVIGSTSNVSLKTAGLEVLGKCKKIIVSRKNTVVVGDPSNEKQKDAITERVSSLRKVLEEDKTLDNLRISKYRERLAKLSGGIAVIRVGGSTEVEISEKKDRVEDAVNATMAAAQEGIVPGGGAALFYVSQYLRDAKFEELTEDELVGVKLIADVCELPLRTIVNNTSVSAEIVVNNMRQIYEKEVLGLTKIMHTRQGESIPWVNPLALDLSFRKGYNAANSSYTDLVDEGIIDPIKVTRYALEHAVSVVGLMLTCNAVVLNIEE